MPQNDDYLSRRQERREAARKKREAEAKRVKRTLFAAVLALAVCGVAFYRLTKDVIPEKPEKPEKQQTQMEYILQIMEKLVMKAACVSCFNREIMIYC